ncbi:FADD protein, partial [Sakesphorus luctuosus]|nr:FADD protein [Sakesphorus luctuosus]
FLGMLHAIAAGLPQDEVESMLFLCHENIPKRRREAVRSGMDLFSILMEQGLLAPDNLRLLKSLLKHIRRSDLLSLVQEFEERGELVAPEDQPDEHEIRRVAIAVIRERVGKEWKKLMRELGLSEVALDRIETANRCNLYEQLVQGLREWQRMKGRDAKVADLIKALRACLLNYVADVVEE